MKFAARMAVGQMLLIGPLFCWAECFLEIGRGLIRIETAALLSAPWLGAGAQLLAKQPVHSIDLIVLKILHLKLSKRPQPTTANSQISPYRTPPLFPACK